MKVFLSRSIYDDPGKIRRIIKELESEGHIVYDGVVEYRKRGGTMDLIRECDLVLVVPCLTPEVKNEYVYARSIGKKTRILRRIVK